MYKPIYRNIMDLELLIFTINEKVNTALKMWGESTTEIDYHFWRGQYHALSEIVTMLINEQNRQKE